LIDLEIRMLARGIIGIRRLGKAAIAALRAGQFLRESDRYSHACLPAPEQRRGASYGRSAIARFPFRRNQPHTEEWRTAKVGTKGRGVPFFSKGDHHANREPIPTPNCPIRRAARRRPLAFLTHQEKPPLTPGPGSRRQQEPQDPTLDPALLPYRRSGGCGRNVIFN